MTPRPNKESLDCASFEDRIHQILDDRLTLSGDDLLTRHAATCPRCAAILNDYDSVDDSIKLLKGEIDRILNESNGNSGSRLSAASRLTGILVSLAAVILIGVGIFHFSGTGTNRTTASTSVIPSSLSSPAGGTKIGSRVGQLAFAKPVALPTPQRSISENVVAEQSPYQTRKLGADFSLFDSFATIRLPRLPDWKMISASLDPLEPVLVYSADLPGVRPMKCSLSVTYSWFKRSFSKTHREVNPDLGFTFDPHLLAAV